jgi:hypothetical protein
MALATSRGKTSALEERPGPDLEGEMNPKEHKVDSD